MNPDTVPFYSRTARALLGAVLMGALTAHAATSTPAPAAETKPTATAGPTVVNAPFQRSMIRYDDEYPTIGYGDDPSHNAIARLQDRLNRGELKLQFQGPRGYLDSVLKALGIDQSSQTLVYSKTSLQLDIIRSATPRAIYFDEDTYIAWIPGTKFLEIATMDGQVGPVFYTLSNVSPNEVRIDRETSRCLTCHDTWGMTGGGVPRFLFLSTLVDKHGESLTGQPGADTTDRTPIRERWAGWFVTGQPTRQEHLGNILVEPDVDVSRVDKLRAGTVASVKGFFDTTNYATDTSDAVALLVFEHQAFVGNLITRANYKSRTLLEKNGVDARTPTWAGLPTTVQGPMKPMLEPLLRALLFVDAAPLAGEIRTNSGYDKWFESRGPRDAAGRSLRDLDLKTRLLKHPLSYLIYSESFDGLPPAARDYVYTRLADILGSRDDGDSYANLPASERRALFEILNATKPDFAKVANARLAAAATRGSSLD